MAVLLLPLAVASRAEVSGTRQHASLSLCTQTLPDGTHSQVVAAVAGIELDIPPFTEGLTNQTPAYLALNAQHAFPLLVTPGGVALASAAPALKELLGRSTAAAKWAEWAATADGFVSGWIDALLGMVPFDEAVAVSTANSFRAHLASLESALASSRFCTLGSGAATDAAVAMSLFVFYLTVFDEKLRASVAKTATFLAATFGSPAVQAALGGVAVVPPTEALQAGGASPLVAFEAVLTQPWSGARTRAAFNEFFETKMHTYWASSSVVPHNDPTLLFTNAGMNQASQAWRHSQAELICYIIVYDWRCGDMRIVNLGLSTFSVERGVCVCIADAEVCLIGRCLGGF